MMEFLQIIFMGIMLGFIGAGAVIGYTGIINVVELLNMGITYIIRKISNKFKDNK